MEEQSKLLKTKIPSTVDGSKQPFTDISVEDLPYMKESELLSFINNTSLKEPYLSYGEVRLLLESFNIETDNLFDDSDVVKLRGNMLNGHIDVIGSQLRMISLERSKELIIAFLELLSKKEKTTFFLSYNNFLLQMTRRDSSC